MYQENPIPENSIKNNIITVEIKKFIALLVFIEIGKISLGKYTFLTILPLLITVKEDCMMVFVKNVQGINATHKKIK